MRERVRVYRRASKPNAYSIILGKPGTLWEKGAKGFRGLELIR
jgi:hypothetical protein